MGGVVLILFLVFLNRVMAGRKESSDLDRDLQKLGLITQVRAAFHKQAWNITVVCSVRNFN